MTSAKVGKKKKRFFLPFFLAPQGGKRLNFSIGLYEVMTESSCDRRKLLDFNILCSPAVVITVWNKLYIYRDLFKQTLHPFKNSQ